MDGRWKIEYIGISEYLRGRNSGRENKRGREYEYNYSLIVKLKTPHLRLHQLTLYLLYCSEKKKNRS